MEFVAIDFETANQHRSSACEVSLVKFSRGLVVDKYTSLIKPHRDMEFNPWNTRIHGLSNRDVAKAPELDEIFEQVFNFTDGLSVVAHNASFDMSVLKRSSEMYGIKLPEIEFYCSLALTKQTNALELASYSLPNVCHALEIEFEEIHRAEGDAIACGLITSKLLEIHGADDLSMLAAQLGIRPGLLSGDSYKSSGRILGKSYPSALGKSAAQAFFDSLSDDDLKFDDDFIGREVIFTGTLSSMKRENAQKMVLRAGGTTGNNITRNTSIVVVGPPYDAELRPGATLSGKLQKVMKLREAGAQIEIMDEIEFLELFEN